MYFQVYLMYFMWYELFYQLQGVLLCFFVVWNQWIFLGYFFFLTLNFELLIYQVEFYNFFDVLEGGLG